MRSVSLIALIAAGTSGVPRYAASLVRAIDAIAPDFPDLDLRLVAHPPAVERLLPQNIPVQFTRALARQTAQQGFKRILLEQACSVAAAGSDYLYFFDLTLPLALPSKQFVATVHDAAVSHNFVRETVWHKQRIQPLAAKRASALVAVSQFAKEEAISSFGAPADITHVIRSGPGLATATQHGEHHQPQPDAPYFLHVGNLLSHKNLPFLIRAFAAVPAPAELLLVGSFGPDLELLNASIAKSPARSRISVKTGVSDDELDHLYRGALAVALPSRYEGFGFTALEAFARNCPVLASDIPAHREIAGDGALLLPVDDEQRWGQELGRLLADSSVREDLRRRGAAAVQRYSWKQTARDVCALLVSL